MEIKKIIDICWKTYCIGCPFYDVSVIIAPEGPIETNECLFSNIPQQWNIEEIQRRLENYGKEKNNNT